jgi:hypothetical protein
MSFADPPALLLLLLLIPVGLLYWPRLRVPRVVVSTGPFWQQALAEESFRARWQRWRTPVSFVLHVLTIILLALAAAGPAIPPPQRIVLILDNSATMRATDVQPTRCDAAKEAARRMVDSLRWCDEMAIVTTSPNPAEIQTLTSNQGLLRTMIDSVHAQAEPSTIGSAIMVAQEIAPRVRSRRQIVIITDRRVREENQAAVTSGVEVLHVGTMAGNRAITCFAARRTKTNPTQYEVFVEVQNHGGQTAQGNLEVSIDGKPGPSVPFAIEKDGRWVKTFDKLAVSRAGRLTARIAPGDSYPFDDIAEIQLGRPYDPDVYYPYLQQIEGGVAKPYRSILLARSHPKQLSVLGMPPYQELLGPLYGEPNGVDIRASNDVETVASALGRQSPRPPLWMLLAAVAALLLVAEWCLCQRCWTS